MSMISYCNTMLADHSEAFSVETFLPKWHLWPGRVDMTVHHPLIQHCDLLMTKKVPGHLQSWWRHQIETISALLALCAGNSPVPVNSLHKGQWRGALMFSLICAWINDWVNNREAGDLRRQRGHYDVIVMVNKYHDGTNVMVTINGKYSQEISISWSSLWIRSQLMLVTDNGWMLDIDFF